jgi:hypothetical protein
VTGDDPAGLGAPRGGRGPGEVLSELAAGRREDGAVARDLLERLGERGGAALVACRDAICRRRTTFSR